MYEIKGDITDSKRYILQYSGFKRVRFRFKLFRENLKADIRLAATLLFKRCYYGPFKGEFGHFLAHNLPFLAYLQSKKVKIYYCGMELHKPFLVDESGNSIITQFYPLRDFFAESPPRANNTVPPADVQAEINKFTAIARKSIYPFWNIDNEFYYWYVHKNWIMKGPNMKTYNLEKVYGKGKEKAAVIFPRKKGNTISRNNGAPWDYMQIARDISPYFDKVYITGHPSMSTDVKSEGNIETRLSADNKVILETCANSQLIITQHSGVHFLGEYTNNQVLIIYKGELPILGLADTYRFRPFVGTRYKLDFAFTEDEIVEYAKNFTFKPNS